jgi:hypothetical protein
MVPGLSSSAKRWTLTGKTPPRVTGYPLVWKSPAAMRAGSPATGLLYGTALTDFEGGPVWGTL